LPGFAAGVLPGRNPAIANQVHWRQQPGVRATPGQGNIRHGNRGYLVIVVVSGLS